MLIAPNSSQRNPVREPSELLAVPLPLDLSGRLAPHGGSIYSLNPKESRGFACEVFV